MAISLSAGMRNAVYSMTDLESTIGASNKRLATGRKVNSALDDARSYFAAQAFNTEAGKLGKLVEGMSQARQTIDKAAKAIDGMIALFEQADSLAKGAQTSTSNTDRIASRDQIMSLLTQATRLGLDSGFNGKTLLVNDAQAGATLTKAATTAGLGAGTAAEKAVFNGGTLNVQTNTAVTGFTEITVAPVDVRLGATVALGGLEVATAANGFAAVTVGANVTYAAAVPATSWDTTNQGQIDGFRTSINNAINSLRTKSAAIATSASVIDVRTQFTKDTIRINKEAADNLVVADINEEGANLSALQTKQQLAVQALSLASRSDQAILRLF